MNPTGSKTIICNDVPPSLLHKTEAKRYFKTFGSIVKIIVKSKSRKCTVEYETAEAAQEAFCLGGEYEGTEFRIEFQLKPTASKQKPRAETDPDWDIDEDVKAELEAMGMGPGSNYSSNKKGYNLRPEKMSIDVELNSLVKKATRAERSEAKKRSAETSVKKSSLNAEKDLLNILRQRAESTEDRYRMLDARDKLVRLRRMKNVDMHMLGVTVGTCPDMCPEKERLMREVQHQVALYEQAGDRSMNHAIAVKQYSRSSADQEAPLPHELRGVDVLQMTMGYLMHRILRMADAPDVNLGEWYHFLWDRMRGIRKDVTQQELCCQGSVRLVEQCARFHVLCSERLVAEDPSVFDQKINTENLTKCLQTLKYMYHDLAIKGERCPNEAEFRAYVILLNLNDGNFMWEVQQLRVDIQKSPEVKFALEVYSSLDNNNFVKFFKLVRRTTYLNACILLRYFVQVRTKALRTIARCYTPRMPHAQYPVAQLTEMLAFESMTSCMEFVENCGLLFTPDMSSVVLSKRDFSDSDVPYALDRAVRVIESKRNKSLGEVMCGEALPPPLFETHVPQNSFTENGALRNLLEFDVEPLGVVSRDRDTVDRREPQVQFKIKERSNSPFTDANSRESWGATTIAPPRVMEDIFSQPSKAGVGGFSFDLRPQRDLAKEREMAEREEQERRRRELEQALKNEEQRQFQELLLLKQQSLEEEKRRLQLQEQQFAEQRRLIEEARIKAEERRLEAERQHKQRLAEKQLEEQRQQRLEAEAQARQVKLAEDARRQQMAQEAKIEAIRIQEIHTVVEIVVDKLVSDVDEECRRTRLVELKINALARFAVLKWRTRVSSNRRKRKAIDQGPLWINKLTTGEMARELYTPQQNLTLNLMKRYKRGVATIAEGRERPLVGKLDAQTLRDLTANHLLANAIKTKRLQNDIFWKIGVYFAAETDVVRRTMDAVVGWNQTELMLQRVKVNQNTLTYCLQKSRLQEDMNGLVIVVQELSEGLVDNLLKYLNTLGDLECMPVFFVLEKENEQLEQEVATLVRNNLISERECLVCDFTPENLSVALARSLSYLSQHYRPPPPLLLNTLRSFLGENLGGEFFQRVRAFAKWNLPYKRCVAQPAVAIGLFNEGLLKLREIVFSTQRLEYPRFPDIFKEHLPNEIPDYLPCDYKYFPQFWKSEEYNASLKSALEGFHLPEYEGAWPLEPGPDLERHVLNYCRAVCDSNNQPQAAEGLFLKATAKLLRATERGSQSWLDVIEVILEHNLKSIDLALPDAYKARTIFNQLFVVYQSDHLQAYVEDTWFHLKNPLVQSAIDDCHEEVAEDPCQGHQGYYEIDPEADAFQLDMHLKRAFEPDVVEEERQTNVKKCKAAMDDFRTLLDDLEESMKIQRKVSEKFQAYLKNYLDT